MKSVKSKPAILSNWKPLLTKIGIGLEILRGAPTMPLQHIDGLPQYYYVAAEA